MICVALNLLKMVSFFEEAKLRREGIKVELKIQPKKKTPPQISRPRTRRLIAVAPSRRRVRLVPTNQEKSGGLAQGEQVGDITSPQT
jgi:hypothetical protein